MVFILSIIKSKCNEISEFSHRIPLVWILIFPFNIYSYQVIRILSSVILTKVERTFLPYSPQSKRFKTMPVKIKHIFRLVFFLLAQFHWWNEMALYYIVFSERGLSSFIWWWDDKTWKDSFREHTMQWEVVVFFICEIVL